MVTGKIKGKRPAGRSSKRCSNQISEELKYLSATHSAKLWNGTVGDNSLTASNGVTILSREGTTKEGEREFATLVAVYDTHLLIISIWLMNQWLT